jgi:hypothetical protein
MGKYAQDNLSFSKGMLPQIDPINLPEGAYLDALNMMRNEVGIIMNECGTSPENITITDGYTIVGVANVEDGIVICSTNDVNSEIGVFDNITGSYTVKYNNTLLGFKSAHRVGIELKVNYAGNRIVYLAGEGIIPRKINLDVITSLDTFDKLTNLFLVYQLPVAVPVSVDSGGNVLTGIYQFGARLVTKSNEVTGFGVISEPLPIGDSSIKVNRKTYDGAPQGTISGNAIKLEISNVDTNFAYLEPCVITYIGDANVIKISSLGKIAIGKSTTISFNYTGQEDEGESISLEEISIDPTTYTSAKYITQKDNTLLLAGLTEEVDTFNWQSVANSIVVTYDIEPIEVIEPISFVNGIDVATGGSFNDYKDPIVCSTKKTYKRDEVYSFTFTPISKSGRRLASYHIPARAGADVSGYIRPVFPAYTANETYPTGFPAMDTGTVLEGTYIRYHKMPSNTVAPFIGVSLTGNNVINILSLNFTIQKTGWESEVSGYIIGREDRAGKETIIDQGIVKDIVLLAEHDGNAPGPYSIPPLLGDVVVIGTDKSNIAGTFSSGNSNSKRMSESVYTLYVSKTVNTYNSPDIITAGNTLGSVPTKIRRVLSLQGGYYFHTPGNENLDDNAEIQGLLSTVFSVIRGGLYDTVDIAESGIELVPKQTTSATDSVRDNNNITLNKFGLSIALKRTLDCLLLKTASALPNSRSLNPATFHWWNNITTDTDIQWQPQNGIRNIDLYELLIPSADLYGGVYDKESLPIRTVLKQGDTLLKTIKCYGGDTFISKYGLTMKDSLPLYGTVGDYQTVPKSSVCVYFYVESNNNYNYRHSVDGTMTYYPKESNVTGVVLGNSVSAGHCEQYNKQYSAQNTIQKNYSKGINEFVTGAFDNRIVYSQTVIEGEQFDAFTSFLVNNYHDIPKQYGSITGLFAQGNDLYVHTQKALWRAFYNTLTTQATSVGEIVLGNSKGFARPSVPVVALSGGYAGCKDISASIASPMGRYFYDASKAKLYLLGEGLQEISNPAVFDLLRSLGDSNTVLGYDFGRKRLLLSSNTLTLSFKPELQSFDSRHSYNFSHFISNRLKDYVISANKVHYFDKTKVGQYIGAYTQNSTLKTASVINPQLSKRYTGAEVVLTASTLDTLINDPWAFFSLLKMYSRERNTDTVIFKVNPDFGELETVGTILVSKANNKFRFGFAPDMVNDINSDIHLDTNLKTHSSFTDEDRLFLPDMIDNHMVFEFTVDNSKSRQVKIQTINVNFDQNIT